MQKKHEKSIIHYMYLLYNISPKVYMLHRAASTTAASPCCPPGCDGLAIAAPIAWVRNASPRVFSITDWYIGRGVR
jgi:hypothetical protein